MVVVLAVLPLGFDVVRGGFGILVLCVLFGLFACGAGCGLNLVVVCVYSFVLLFVGAISALCLC